MNGVLPIRTFLKGQGWVAPIVALAILPFALLGIWWLVVLLTALYPFYVGLTYALVVRRMRRESG